MKYRQDEKDFAKRVLESQDKAKRTGIYKLKNKFVNAYTIGLIVSFVPIAAINKYTNSLFLLSLD
ncbi:hypothetical protein DKL61_07170 [Gammaproteobacteria bacterium ESL0073]|nr:hypothetical protein DKL61_07170 [Gammaproteobacteria bacterium ESL0073]